MKNSDVWRFIGVTCALGVATQFLAVADGVNQDGRSWLKLTMWAPAVGALTSAPARRAAWAAVRKSGGRWFVIALGVGWAMTLLQNALLFLLGKGHWNNAMFVLDEKGTSIAAVHQVAMALGVGPQSFGVFALNLAVSVTLGSLLGGVLGGLGEELGWRAVLQPELERRWGPLRGSLVVGLIWAYWHLPANLNGYNDATHPLWNALVFFPVAVVAMAFSFGWLTRHTKSVWPAAIAHGANNAISAGFLLTPQDWWWDTATMLMSALLVLVFFALTSRPVLLERDEHHQSRLPRAGHDGCAHGQKSQEEGLRSGGLESDSSPG